MTKCVTHENDMLIATFPNGDNIQFNTFNDGTAHCDNFQAGKVFVEVHHILLTKFAITEFERVLEACEQSGSVQGVCNRLGIMFRASINNAK